VILGYASQPLLLELGLSDRAAKHPQVAILNTAGSPVAGPLDMVGIGTPPGLYHASWAVPVVGQFTAWFNVYADPAHTILAPYEPVVEHIRVQELGPDQSFRKLLAHHGENVRDDVLTYDGATGRPLTFRRRIFPDAATANLSTPGGAGEGEIATITGTAIHIDSTKWSSLLRKLQ
jgi:hypothetical protein